MSVLSVSDRRLAAILLERGFISDDDLQIVLSRLTQEGGRLIDLLIDDGLVAERRVIRAIEDVEGIPFVELSKRLPSTEALSRLTAQQAHLFGCVPFALEGDLLHLACADCLDEERLEHLARACGCLPKPYQALRRELTWALATYYPELGFEVPQLEPAPEADEALATYLVRQGFITALDADRASRERVEGETFEHSLVRLGVLDEEELYRVIAERAGLPFVLQLEAWHVPQEVAAFLTRADARRFHAVPLEVESGRVLVATARPDETEPLAELFEIPPRFVVALPQEVDQLIERLYAQTGRLGERLVQAGKMSREQLAQAMHHQRAVDETKPLGEVLVELGFVSDEEIAKVLAKQRSAGSRLEDALVRSNVLGPEAEARALALELGYRYLAPGEIIPDPTVVELIPEQLARRYGCLPVSVVGKDLLVAMKDPRNVFAIDDLRLITKHGILPAVAAAPVVDELIERIYGGDADMLALNRELEQLGDLRTEATDAGIDESAVVRTIDTIIRDALFAEASDIHIEPGPQSVLVRIRVDGRLREYMHFPKNAGPGFAARVKVMAGLDIAERRLPQDGRARFRSRSVMQTDLRVSTLPTVYGEKVVMRVLQRAAAIPEIEDLGFSEWNYGRYRDLIEKPYGILLLTGPTGSGKSRTTFSTLKRIARPDKNVLTIEDPVEYELPGINQAQVNNLAGMTFARALRAFLRQDPDIIMVGEIRDRETAMIAVEAALTGHLVIATLHTNDTAGAVTRLSEMGVEPFNISGSLIGVLAQRLVRVLCKHCSSEVAPDPDVLRRLEIRLEDIPEARFFRGTGCAHCNGSGYKGRMAIHELMVVDDVVRRAIIEGRTSPEIKEVAIERSGMKTLRYDGIAKSLQGHTSLEEVLAVTAE